MTRKMWICPAVVTSKVTCYVEAATLDEAKAKFKAGDWDDYDDDGGEVQSVECDWKQTTPDGPYEEPTADALAPIPGDIIQR